MSTLDIIILWCGKITLFAFGFALVPFLLWLGFYLWSRVLTNTFGRPLIRAAINAYRKTNPEAFAKFNKVNRWKRWLSFEEIK